MTKEDVESVKPVSGSHLFGYDESVRNKSKYKYSYLWHLLSLLTLIFPIELNDIIGLLQNQINEVRTKANKFNEAAKKMVKPADK